MSKSNEWRLPAGWPDPVADYVDGVAPKQPAPPQTHLWLLGERTNRCGLDPLGDHHTHQPDEVTCFACRALLAEDREDMKSAALVAAQRALRETQAERDALLLAGRKLRMELFNALAKTETQAARIAELEKELNSVRELLKDAEQRTAVGRESGRELEKKLDFVQRSHEAQEAQLRGQLSREQRDGRNLADEVAALVRRKVLDSRSPVADALLDYREPPSTPRADRIAELEKEKARLLEAAKLAAAWMWDPDESPGEQFDRIAEWFCRETGFLRPGKSEPFECARSPHERQAAWVAWSTEKNRAARAALTALRDAIAEAEVGP